MKCKSIACLYPSSSSSFLHSHKVTAFLPLLSPPSLVTGSSNGSIIFWSFSDPNPDPIPISLLCGHSTSITFLSLTSTSSFLSASSDSLLCRWSLPSLRCHLRRPLPLPFGPPLFITPHTKLQSCSVVLCANAVLILDSLTLNVVRVILKGSFTMVRALMVIENDAVLIDGYGNKLVLNLEKEEDDEEAGGLEECGIASVAVSEDGKILALVHESKCVFKLVGSGDEMIGEVCYGDRMLAAGGIFLKEFDGFLVWSRDGFGIVYSIVSGSHNDDDNGFKFDLSFNIPGLNGEFDERSVVWFCQFGSRLVKLESLCLELSGRLLWKPYVSIWSIPVDSSTYGSCKLLGTGGYSNEETHGMHKAKCSNNDVMSDMHIISCSMVLSEDSYVPYGVIYGFYNGDIEVIRFISHVPNTQNRQLEQRFLGHKDAVICLAAHCIIRDLVDQSVLRVLISGSTDCTVRIWDLDSGNVLSVLHHHVSSVKQIILPQPGSDHPWNNCFLTVGEDSCVALVSLENLRVERMFPGHIIYPSLVAWDSKRGYLSCLCQNLPSSSSSSSSTTVLYIWDVKSGARERIIRGTASHSMFDNLCKGLNLNSGSTSASSLPNPFVDGPEMTQTTHINNKGKSSLQSENTIKKHALKYDREHPVKFSSPFPGITTLEFDLSSLMSLHSEHDVNNDVSVEEHLLRFSLCFLHLWDVDEKLDSMLVKEMGACKPSDFRLGTGVVGDRGSLTLTLPGLHAILELWKSSSEYCAMRSLVIVSLTQRMISLSHSSTSASSALAAFYTRNFAEKVPYIKPPLLQLLVSFWQDPSEHVRMAARSLFHCAAPHAIPYPLACHKTTHLEIPNKENYPINIDSDIRISSIVDWIESSDTNEWISWIDGTNQEAMASHIIVAAALVVWYPSIVKADLANLVVNQLVKLVLSMNDGFSSTAAELLSEGMESTWKLCLGHEIPHLINDVFFQIECLLGTSSNTNSRGNPLSSVMQEALIEILLPSLAMADIAGFLNVIESQLWATSSDSPVHLVSLKTIIRVVRGATKPLAPYLDKVVNYILLTIDPGNLVMRKLCLKSSMTTLKEITRSFPMVGMDESSTRLAVGDPIGDIRSSTIQIYDIESVTKVKVLDASGPLGLPNFIEGSTRTKMATAISALSFSPDGEGLVAFSENGLMIRWWPLGISWWEKISRNLVPVQCAKLIFVPPWEGFSPNSSRSSIMANIFGNSNRSNSQESPRESDNAENLKILLHNLDLSYRLQWVGGRSVQLTRHGQDLGTFPL